MLKWNAFEDLGAPRSLVEFLPRTFFNILKWITLFRNFFKTGFDIFWRLNICDSKQHLPLWTQGCRDELSSIPELVLSKPIRFVENEPVLETIIVILFLDRTAESHPKPSSPVYLVPRLQQIRFRHGKYYLLKVKVTADVIKERSVIQKLAGQKNSWQISCVDTKEIQVEIPVVISSKTSEVWRLSGLEILRNRLVIIPRMALRIGVLVRQYSILHPIHVILFRFPEMLDFSQVSAPPVTLPCGVWSEDQARGTKRMKTFACSLVMHHFWDNWLTRDSRARQGAPKPVDYGIML